MYPLRPNRREGSEYPARTYPYCTVRIRFRILGPIMRKKHECPKCSRLMKPEPEPMAGITGLLWWACPGCGHRALHPETARTIGEALGHALVPPMVRAHAPRRDPEPSPERPKRNAPAHPGARTRTVGGRLGTEPLDGKSSCNNRPLSKFFTQFLGERVIKGIMSDGLTFREWL